MRRVSGGLPDGREDVQSRSEPLFDLLLIFVIVVAVLLTIGLFRGYIPPEEGSIFGGLHILAYAICVRRAIVRGYRPKWRLVILIILFPHIVLHTIVWFLSFGEIWLGQTPWIG